MSVRSQGFPGRCAVGFISSLLHQRTAELESVADLTGRAQGLVKSEGVKHSVVNQRFPDTRAETSTVQVCPVWML